MSIDAIILMSIQGAVEKNGQTSSTAEKLIKWFEQVATSNESIEEKDVAFRHVEDICSSIAVDESLEAGEEA